MAIAYGMEALDATPLQIEIYHYFYSDVDGVDVDGLSEMSLSEKRALPHKLSRLEHFYNIVDILINVEKEFVVRNEWLDDMIKAMIEYDWVSLAGSGSSGKSFAAALKGLIDFICSPHNSLILITSTSIAGAQLRVWKSVNELWNKIPNKDSYGVMVMTSCKIRGYDADGNPSNDIGLQIVAAGSGSEKDAEDKLIGIKSENLMLIADELPNLPMKIVEIAETNLSGNEVGRPFQMYSLGNPSLRNDPHGVVSEPTKGWKSVDENCYKWETPRGVCLRFDAERSPDIMNKDKSYPWYPSAKNINLAKKKYGPRSLQFYRQYKAFWFDGASTETVYNVGEIAAGNCNKPYDESIDGDIVSVEMVAGADPSYIHGGDVFPFCLCRVIRNVNEEVFFELVSITKMDDEIGSNVNRTKESVKKLEELCSRNGVLPENFGYDGTGSGISFGDMISDQWSNLPLNVLFGGKPSDMKVGFNDDRKASEVYGNKVSELWLRMKPMIADGKVRGLTNDVIDQMVSRMWSKTNMQKETVESKRIMKARVGESCDLADSLFVAFYVAIHNGMIDVLYSSKMFNRVSPKWDEAKKAANEVYLDMWI